GREPDPGLRPGLRAAAAVARPGRPVRGRLVHRPAGPGVDPARAPRARDLHRHERPLDPGGRGREARVRRRRHRPPDPGQHAPGDQRQRCRLRVLRHLVGRRDGGHVRRPPRGGGAVTERLVVISPPPPATGDLHLGHPAGPFLAADVHTRYARAVGREALFGTGIQDTQTYVVTTAHRLGVTPQDLVARSTAEVTATLAALGICPDGFTGVEERFTK